MGKKKFGSYLELRLSDSRGQLGGEFRFSLDSERRKHLWRVLIVLLVVAIFVVLHLTGVDFRDAMEFLRFLLDTAL